MKLAINFFYLSNIIAINQQFESLIFSGSIRENILFGSDYNNDRYDKVIDDCALRDDFLEIKGGDSIQIGGAGAILSGGQMQRLSIGMRNDLITENSRSNGINYLN